VTPLLASTPEAGMDAGDAGMDAGLFAASTPSMAPDLRERADMDAGDAMDAAMQPLSNPALCSVCHEPMDTSLGGTTHPTC